MVNHCTKSAWSTYRSARELYYVDDIEQVVPILSTGIGQAGAVHGEGRVHTIICFTKRTMATAVAQRLGMANFALFAIKKNAIPKHCIQWERLENHDTGALLYCFCDHIEKDAVELVDCFQTSD